MKHLTILTLFIVFQSLTNITYGLNNDFTQGFSQNFKTQNNTTFNQNFNNPNSYMNKNKYTGTSQNPPPIQHNIFNYDTTRYNSSCQFGTCTPGGN